MHAQDPEKLVAPLQSDEDRARGLPFELLAALDVVRVQRRLGAVDHLFAAPRDQLD